MMKKSRKLRKLKIERLFTHLLQQVAKKDQFQREMLL
jgi:hypothetical protein